LSPSDSKLSADGDVLSFAFQAATARLTRTGDGAALLDVCDAGKAIPLDLQRG
jgi:hypothetical protein